MLKSRPATALDHVYRPFFLFGGPSFIEIAPPLTRATPSAGQKGPVLFKIAPDYLAGNNRWRRILDSNNISIGIHFFKVLVQIHYSRSPGSRENNLHGFSSICELYVMNFSNIGAIWLIIPFNSSI